MSAPFETTPNIDAGEEPIILPWPAGSRDSRGSPDDWPELERFAFPELPPPPAGPAAADAQQRIWPECASARTARACSELAESLRRQLPTDRPAVVAFTSPGDGDGKSALLLSLAPELARRSPGGLLVADGDFHCAELTGRLSISCPQTGEPSPLIYATNFPGLSVLPIPTAIQVEVGQGEKSPNPRGGENGTLPFGPRLRHSPAGTLAEERPGAGRRAMRAAKCPPTVRINPQWIDQWRENWPLVLLNAASLRHADVWPMLERCDGAYLVVCIGHTRRRALCQAASTFRARGVPLLGCVAMTPAGPEDN
jgi:Mrp family chromosome partitioning ATPase